MLKRALTICTGCVALVLVFSLVALAILYAPWIFAVVFILFVAESLGGLILDAITDWRSRS